MKTTTGFEFEIEDDVLDDWELIKKLREIDKGNVQYMVDVMPMLLGKEQSKRLEEHVRDENGKISAAKIVNELEEIMILSNKVKN